MDVNEHQKQGNKHSHPSRNYFWIDQKTKKNNIQKITQIGVMLLKQQLASPMIERIAFLQQTFSLFTDGASFL